MVHHIMGVVWFGIDFTSLMTQSKILQMRSKSIQKIRYTFITGVAATEIWENLNIQSKTLMMQFNMITRTQSYIQIVDLLIGNLNDLILQLKTIPMRLNLDQLKQVVNKVLLRPLIIEHIV